LSASVHGQTELTIDSFTSNGRLSWSNCPGALEYRVEWTPQLDQNGWTNSWDVLNGIDATGTYYTVEVPMFYRLIAVMPDYTRLLLHCDGSNGSTNFPDMTGRHHVQVVGGIQVSTAESRFGGGSAAFDGTLNHWLTIPDSSDFDPGFEPFTIDFWMYPTNQNVQGQYLVGKSYPDSGRGYDIRYHLNAIQVVGVNGWAANITSPPILTNGAWYHVAVSCTTNQAFLFINGTNRGTSGRGNIADTADAVHIGDSPGFGGNAFHGYLDEIRYSLGIARWTNDFVMASVPWADD
jgi:hypothetical protein